MIRQNGDTHEQQSGEGNIPADWLAEFEAAARRPLELRMKYAFIKTYKPVLGDELYQPPLVPPCEGGRLAAPLLTKEGVGGG